MKSKKQQNGKGKVNAVKVEAVEEAVKEETVAVTTKTNNRKRQSTEVSQAPPPKIKKEEEVLSAVAKSKKRKNRKKNTAAKKKLVQIPKQGEQDGDLKAEVSIAYLKQWQQDRKHWKFQKIRQIWLNDNMLNDVTLPDSVFPTWLEYMAGSSDRQKQFVVKKATEALNELEAEDSTVDADDARYQRAKTIIQSLDVKEEEDEEEEDSSESS